MADDGGEHPPPAKKKSPAEEAAEKRSVPVRSPDSEVREVQFRDLVLCFCFRMYYYFAIQLFHSLVELLLLACDHAMLVLCGRRKKLTPGSLMKGLIRSGSGDATPAEGDQVTTSTCNIPSYKCCVNVY
jgi:hypothetical protein